MRKVQHINPDGLSKNPAFSQAITVQGNGKTVYIGGQNAVTAKGEIIGTADLSAQTEQVMKNLQIALEASGAKFENLVKLTIYIVQGQDIMKGFQASQKYLGHLKNPPTVSGLFISALARPEFLVEVDAVAFVPE